MQFTKCDPYRASSAILRPPRSHLVKTRMKLKYLQSFGHVDQHCFIEFALLTFLLQQLAESGVAAFLPALDESEENAASNHFPASD